MSARFSLRQLTYFLAVAERGSLRAAAEALNVSPTALTQALNELEQELGTALLHRQRAVGAHLTQAGTGLIGQARAVVDAATDLQSLAERWEMEPAGQLAVGCYATLSPFLVARLVRGFRESCPAIELDIRDGSQEAIFAGLSEGRMEFGIVYEHELADTFERDVLYRLRPHVILPADHRLATHGTVSLADLADEPLILYDAAPSGANTLGIFAYAGVSPQISRRTANYELVRSLVGAGLGYSVLLQQPASDITHDGGHLVRRPIHDRTRDFSVVLAWARGARLSRRAEAFRGFCLSAFANGPLAAGKEARPEMAGGRTDSAAHPVTRGAAEVAYEAGPTRLRDFSRSLPMALLRAREAVMGAFRPFLRSLDITEQQWRVLRALTTVESIGALKLAAATFLLPPSLSRILRDLEVRGLVRRSSDADDLRRGIVSISPTGTELVERAGHISEAIYAEIARRYGPLRLGELQAMLKELEEAMQEPIGLPSEAPEAAELSSASE